RTGSNGKGRTELVLDLQCAEKIAVRTADIHIAITIKGKPFAPIHATAVKGNGPEPVAGGIVFEGKKIAPCVIVAIGCPLDMSGNIDIAARGNGQADAAGARFFP